MPLLMLCAIASQAQALSTTSRKAIKNFEEGRSNFTLMYYQQARADLEKAIAADKDFLEAYLLLADVYKAIGDSDQALEIYKKVVVIDQQHQYPEAWFFAGLICYQQAQYATSIPWFENFLAAPGGATAKADDADYYLHCAEFARVAVVNPVPFVPVNIGAGINTAGDEYINAVRADELTLFFTGRQMAADGSKEGDDFYYSVRSSDTMPWPASTKLGAPVNTPGDEGALTISWDGGTLLFAGCHWDGGYGSCDIYASQLSANKAGTPVNLGPVINTAKWESQPSLAADGRTLYFASTRGGGFGNSDIWCSHLYNDGSWSVPENLGDVINTSGSEMAPFIHPDGRTLYFSSDRHIGLGGIDLYVSHADSLGRWGAPINLGYPINTASHEINIIVSATGDKAYISANRLGGMGGYDIFEFPLYETIRPQPATYAKGQVTDAMTHKPLEAYFSLTNLLTKKEIVRSFSDAATGQFIVCIPASRQYALNVSRKGYLFYSENIAISGLATELKPHLINIALQPIEAGETMVLRNIFFDTDKYELKEVSLVELDILVNFLKNNPGIGVQISGHTDNIGSAEYNLTLSRNRAKAVVDYLTDQNIAPSRLTFEGYGDQRPVAENATAQGRALNRRTEVMIMSVE
ncbi:MAG: tetratricopeptide repeat protein [Clostridia bacterium]|nr:tetratricopeptide repeat protein [Clostridia bacterium]